MGVGVAAPLRWPWCARRARRGQYATSRFGGCVGRRGEGAGCGGADDPRGGQSVTGGRAGEKDQNAPLDTVIAAYKAMPNAQLAIIPNAPHSVFQVNFPAVWASVEPFLNAGE